MDFVQVVNLEPGMMLVVYNRIDLSGSIEIKGDRVFGSQSDVY